MKPNDPKLVVRFARDELDLYSAQHLRYRVFVEELKANPADAIHQEKREVDRFDDAVTHLCLVDTEREKQTPERAVIGVYRLITEEASADIGGFYSEGEYDLSPILKQAGRKLELGRSCIDPEYRGGSAMAMLWSALGAYIEENGIDYLFGSASYHGTDTLGKRQSLANLYYHYLAPEALRARVLPENRLDMGLFPVDEIDRLYAMRDTPSLIKAYLRLGGMIGDGAYVDHAFNTIDVFVLMKTREMVAKYKAMYQR